MGRTRTGSAALGAVLALALLGCEGPAGTAGMDGNAGADGKAGTNGVSCWDLNGNGAGDVATEDKNKDGKVDALDCTGGAGQEGADGQACWDLNGNGAIDLATEDKNADGKADVKDCAGPAGTPGTPGTPGQPGAGYLKLETAGLVGFVRDVAGYPVIGAKVYLVPSSDVPTAALALTDIVAERASSNDEPLEDAIASKGYTPAVTDANGIYRITTVAAGSYFLVAVPVDASHLPGGSLCRKAMASTAFVGKQLDIELSSKPSDKAEYVGPSVCLTCHGMQHEMQTLHALGIRKIGETSPLQNSSRFPTWNDPLTTKFTAAGTTLYFFGYNGNAASPDWKVSETQPTSGASFSAKLYSAGGKYFVDLTDLKGTTSPATYEVEMSYGGGLYKQRYLAKIGTSRYVLPIQFNVQGQTDETQPYSRWVWNQYNAQNWYDEAVPGLKLPSKSKSFDNNCAGCHFSGYAVTGDATTGYKAHGVPDKNGEMDYDGDGLTEALNISCENCHGPGSEHWAKAGGGGRAIVSPRLLTPEREVAICSQCHTRALGVGGGATEAPLDAAGHMPRAGISRKDFLANHISKLDDGQWDAVKGDGKHAKKHHQQVSDFLKTKKYRNASDLVTCASCHDLHGNTGLPHQLLDNPDKSASGPGLCAGCHDAKLPAGATFAARVQAHYAAKGIMNVAMNDIGCADCHMSKTAKSGSGLKGMTIAGTTYYSGDIASHLFDVPRRTSIATKAADMMAIPYTNACGSCHSAAP